MHAGVASEPTPSLPVGDTSEGRMPRKRQCTARQAQGSRPVVEGPAALQELLPAEQPAEQPPADQAPAMAASWHGLWTVTGSSVR